MRELEHPEGGPQVIEDVPGSLQTRKIKQEQRNKFSVAITEVRLVTAIVAGAIYEDHGICTGLILVVLGIGSLLVPIPHSEKHGIKAGDVNIGVETAQSERVSPIISVVLIAGGIALTVGGARMRSSTK